jgi:restriction system protein
MFRSVGMLAPDEMRTAKRSYRNYSYVAIGRCGQLAWVARQGRDGPIQSRATPLLRDQDLAAMPIPPYHQFIDPLLRVLAEHPLGLTAADGYDRTADRVGISAEERTAMIPSGGQPLYKNRIGWAHDSLKRGLFAGSSKVGWWQITDKGKHLVAEFPEGIPESKAKEMGKAKSSEKMADIQAAVTGIPLVDAVPTSVDLGTPDERIVAARAEIRERTISELLELLHQVKPEFFERIVLDVLFSMGYGESREALQHVGGPGDGGIDGVVPLDKLGLQKVYVQAKRWQGKVGNSEMLNFIGALGTKGADKGVIITTSDFTTQCLTILGHSKHSIALVNGRKLAMLMIDHGVGVVSKSFSVAEVSKDYFSS